MPHRVPPIARIRLARSLPRLLAWPVIVVVTGAMATGSWYLGSFGTGAGGLVFAVIGGVLVVAGIAAAVVLLSIRVEVHEAAVRLSWLGGERIYPLVQGPVTRVRLLGSGASRLRPRTGFFGWAIGSARLRDEEDVQVVRLARTRTAILVPTELGRLAIGAASEDQLLDALSHAARARQRLEELAETARPPEHAPAADVEPPAPTPVPAPVEVEPRLMTGIERALLEQRLAEERAEAQRPASAPSFGAGDAEAADVAATAQPVPVAARPGERRGAFGLRRPRPSAAFVLLPLLGAGAAWGVGLLSGTYPEPGTDVGRLTALALVLAGPATSVGAIMARAWWPRLVGVVVSGGLAASAFIARGLLG